MGHSRETTLQRLGKSITARGGRKQITMVWFLSCNHTCIFQSNIRDPISPEEGTMSTGLYLLGISHSDAVGLISIVVGEGGRGGGGSAG